MALINYSATGVDFDQIPANEAIYQWPWTAGTVESELLSEELKREKEDSFLIYEDVFIELI